MCIENLVKFAVNQSVTAKQKMHNFIEKELYKRNT